MDPNIPNTYDHDGIYFNKDDAERYMRGYEAYEQFLAMSNQVAGGSGSALMSSTLFNKIVNDITNYDVEPLPKVPEANNDLNVLYGSPLFDDVLADRAPEAPFVVNVRTYKPMLHLANGHLLQRLRVVQEERCFVYALERLSDPSSTCTSLKTPELVLFFGLSTNLPLVENADSDATKKLGHLNFHGHAD
ncbi:reverse transcriptase domain-containing protein [Tanacetum coccineum]